MSEGELSATETLLERQVAATTRQTHATRTIAIFLIWFTLTGLGLALLFGLGLAFGGDIGLVLNIAGVLAGIAGIWYTLSASLDELRKSRNP